jgi:hypothetical protein
MTKGLLTSRITKLKLESIHAKSPSATNLASYKKYRNLYNTTLRACKKLHFSKAILSNANNLKKTWSILNSALNKPSMKNPILSLYVNNSLVTDPLTIANSFNSYFTNIASEIANDIHPSDSPPLPPSHPAHPDIPIFNMADSPVTEDEILSCIKLLQDKRTSDMTGLSTHLLKKIIHTILTPLSHIFTKSLSSGVVPSHLKIAKIIPIFKSGDCLDMNNYRPISLLSTFSKILEKIVCSRLTNFLESNSLLSPQQFGFRSKHSTIHPMTLLLNKLTKSSNSKLYSIVIFCDLKKAFDTCNHSTLLDKLYSIGVRGTELAWFKSYLTDRQQFTSINDTDSLLLTILNGVPQGSILGPLLFLIYINDLPNATALFSLLFADDTALTASSDNLTELYSFVNTEFRKLCSYFRSNKLSLHPDKTKYLLISPSLAHHQTDLQIFLNNNNLNENNPTLIFPLSRVNPTDPVPAIKYLGIYFDPQLNFKYHISTISKKLSNALFSLRRVKNLLPPHSLKTLYYSLFHCHLVYGIEIWSCILPSLLKPLLVKQKSAIRCISNSHYNAHTEPLFKSLNILPLPKLILLSNLKFFHSFVYNLIPSTFTNTWLTTLEQRHNDGQIHLLYNLRNNDDYFVPPTRNHSLSRYPLYNLPSLWNDASASVKAIPSKATFSITLKKQFIGELSPIPQCNRLLCPACLRVAN